MASSNAPRFLDKGGETDAIALKMYSGSVMEGYYNKRNWFDESGGIVAFKRLGPDQGKSTQFIRVADGEDAEDHIPGQELLGQNYAFDEGTITVDDIVVSHVDVPVDLSLKAHFNDIAPLGTARGRKVAEKINTRIAITAVKAARTASVTKDGLLVHNGGNVVERVGASGLASAYASTVTGARALRDDFEHMGQLMDEDNVPDSSRYAFISPYLKRVLSNDTNLYDRDLSAAPGDLAGRMIGRLAGFWLIVDNNIPTTEITSVQQPNAKYQGDFRYNGSVGQPAAVFLCGADEAKAAVGMVQFMGLQAYMAPDHRRNTTFIKAQTMVGMGVLAPESAGELRVTAS